MEPLTSTKSTLFEWTRSGKVSNLVSDGQVYATVTWVKGWGSLATGESADGRWTLKRVGFLRPRVTVRTEGSQSDLAVVTVNTGGGGKIAFMDVSEFTLRRTGFWHPELVLIDSTGRRIFSMKPSSGFKRGATFTLEDEAARSSWRTSLLVIIVWYLGVLVTEYDQDASLASIAAASSVTVQGHG